MIEKQDELSLIMLINKLKSSEEFKTLKDIPSEYFENLEQNTPEYLLKLLGKIIAVFLYRLNVPRKEIEHFTDQIARREFDMLFDSFEAYDVQETRRVSREEGRLVGKIEDILELLEDIGTVPDDLKQTIEAETDANTLSTWLKLAAKVESIEEFRNSLV